jgi:hypothetical protein
VTERRLWPTRRTTEDFGLQLAWGLLQGLVIGLLIVAVFGLVRLLG